MITLLKIIVSSIVALFLSLPFGQVEANSELHPLLAQKDSLLFNAAFNTCNTSVLKEKFTEDSEFYHNTGGFTEGRDAFLNPIKENCAQRITAEIQPSKRILIANSLAVYPLYKNSELYGAHQHGIHLFKSLDKDNSYQRGDITKFTHVWSKENLVWKVKRELRYDHQYNQ
jgi:hypothetical protein